MEVTLLLEKISNAHGPSGYETEVRELIFDEIKDNVALHQTDALGNLITRVGDWKGYDGPRLLISAHMDEVGFAVTEITSTGGLKFHKMGGIDDRVLPSKRLLVGRGEKRIAGVVSMKSPHLHKTREEFNKVIKHDSLFVDIGTSKKEEAEKLVSLGEPMTWATEYFEQGNRAFGKAFDDRAGCAIIAELVKESPKLTGGTPFLAAFTTQEEVGVRGGKVAGYATNPDVFIAVEGTTAGDVPGPANGRDVTPSTVLGDGPALSILDQSHISDTAWREFVEGIARDEGIGFQYKRSVTGGTESGILHKTRTGVRCLTISVPVRYIHSPVGILDKGDYAATKKLIASVIRRLAEFPA